MNIAIFCYTFSFLESKKNQNRLSLMTKRKRQERKRERKQKKKRIIINSHTGYFLAILQVISKKYSVLELAIEIKSD